MNSTHGIIVVAVVLGAVLAGQAEDARTDKWKVQAGWVHQWGRGMHVDGPAPSLPNNDFPALTLGGTRLLSGRPSLTYPDNSLLIPRLFSDGSVQPDYWTTDAGLLSGPNPERYGMTWNWRADSAGQYNYDGGNHPTLSYQIGRGAVLDGEVTVAGDNTSDNDLPADGVEVKVSRLLHSWPSGAGAANDSYTNVLLNMDLVLGLAWFRNAKQHSSRSVDQRVYGQTERYTYSDYYGASGAPGGPWPALVVPYSGSYGSATDAGPLLPATPESSVMVSSLVGTLRDSVVIESQMWCLRGEIGLEFAKPLTERLTVWVTPQFVLECVDMRVTRTETVTFAGRSSGATTQVGSAAYREQKTALEPGFLLTAGADYRFSEHWFAGASLGREWLVDDPSVKVGPDRVSFDLDGDEVSLFLGRTF